MSTAERGWEVKEFRKRRKNGRRGIVRASAAGAVWATVAVARGVKSAGKATVNRVTRRPIAVKDDERSHGL